MKTIIKNFLFKKRFKILKSKKGFSLLEVLIAVGIIAIISAIAVPQYTANRKEAAIVAGDTSITNIMKAYQHCLALKSASECNSLSLLNVTCPDCSSETSTGGVFCAHIRKEVGGKAFAACVSINGSVSTRSYGGQLLTGSACHLTQAAAQTPANCAAKPKTAMTPYKKCSANTDCGTDAAATTTDCGKTYTCDPIATTATAGTCKSSDATCQ